MPAAEQAPGWGPDDAGLPSDEFLAEAAYLVSRGVRPMALVGHCKADPMVMLRAQTRLGTARKGFDVLPFIVHQRENDWASCGYAACAWVISLYEATWHDKGPFRHEITGLLLGYSPQAIARHGELDSGWQFTPPGDGKEERS